MSLNRALTAAEKLSEGGTFATSLQQHAAATRLARQMYGARRAWALDRHPGWKALPVSVRQAYVALAVAFLDVLRWCPSEPHHDQLIRMIMKNQPTVARPTGQYMPAP